MSFKTMAAADLEILFNPDEFAEPHTIDGMQRLVVVDNDRLRYRSKVEYDGVVAGDILFYVSAAGILPQPRPGDRMKFDGVPCTVFDVREDTGMLEIILQRNVG